MLSSCAFFFRFLLSSSVVWLFNNQTTEYNKNDENTTVKDLQRRATFRDV